MKTGHSHGHDPYFRLEPSLCITKNYSGTANAESLLGNVCIRKRNIVVCNPEAKSGNGHGVPMLSTGAEGSGCADNNIIKTYALGLPALGPYL